MIDALQVLVEGLAQDLKRSVAVDDAGLRLLASSTHFEDVDSARIGSLVGRRVSGAARDYVMASGVQSWHEPTLLPANTHVGLDKDRYAIPLRSKFELLGIMWLLHDGTLSDTEISLAEEVANRIRDLLVRRTETEDDADIEIESLILGLLADTRRARQQAAEDLRHLGLFARSTCFSLLVVRVQRREGGPTTQAVREAVRRGITQAMQGRLRESYAYSTADDHALLLIGHRAAPRPAQLTTLATTIHAELERFADDVAAVAALGLGDTVDSLTEVARAFDQAMVAADVARDLGQAAAAWANHPLECLLRSWLRPSLRTEMVPPIVHGLMAQPEELIEVLEAYLDSGCNVAQTAADLHLHRTTIYYRLNRLQETIGVDLNDGSTRLLIHLWLKGRRVCIVGS